VKQKTALAVIVIALLLVWACTPSALLRRGKAPVADVPADDVPTGVLPKETKALAGNLEKKLQSE